MVWAMKLDRRYPSNGLFGNKLNLTFVIVIQLMLMTLAY